MNWKDTIFQCQDQVNGMVPKPAKSQRYSMDELRSQITEIRHSLEDLFISSNQIIVNKSSGDSDLSRQRNTIENESDSSQCNDPTII
jgi:hypothetical protein